MASSSLTCPPSSRRTICSSSASASSKFIAAISAGTSTSTIYALPSRLREQVAVREPETRARNSADVARLQHCRAWFVPSHRHQHAYMRCDAGTQRRQIITAFERRDDAAASIPLGDLDQPLGDPGIVRLVEQELRQRVVSVRVEASRYQQELGANASSAGRMRS